MGSFAFLDEMMDLRIVQQREGRHIVLDLYRVTIRTCSRPRDTKNKFAMRAFRQSNRNGSEEALMLGMTRRTRLVLFNDAFVQTADITLGMSGKLFGAMTVHAFLEGRPDKRLVALSAWLNIRVVVA